MWLSLLVIAQPEDFVPAQVLFVSSSPNLLFSPNYWWLDRTLRKIYAMGQM